MVGPEAAAARAIDIEPVVQFFDPILDVAAATVDGLVEKARRLAQVITKRGLSVSGKPGASLVRSRRAGLDTERHEDAGPAQTRTHGHGGDGRLAGVH